MIDSPCHPFVPTLLLSALCAATISPIHGQTEGEFGMSAPPEAYEEGNPFPYFGSENPWNRRMFGDNPANLFYKRRGQRQILATIDGNPGQAAEWARSRITNDPRDQESWFNLIIALGQLKRTEEMVATMHQALEAGLPFERLVAGPRDLLTPLYSTDEYKQIRDALDVRLVHGPILGDFTDSSILIWVRTARSSEVTIEAIPLSRIGNDAKAVFRTTEAADYSGVGRLEGLLGDTVYRYRIQVDGSFVSFPGEAIFRTAPAPGQSGRYVAAFGGGAGFTPKFERIWDTILGRQPQVLLLLGDNVYLDVPEAPGSYHQYTYYRRQSRPEFRRLTSSVATYAIWDDHDAGMDDIWLGPYLDRPDWKRANFEFFLQNWNNPTTGDPATPGGWFSFALGDLEFFMIDGRSYRTNPFAPEKTMLGPVQKAWLLKKLSNSTATFKILVSPVPWTELAKKGSLDTWCGFKEERDRIFDFIYEKGISGVVLVSSDRHRSDAWEIDRKKGYRFYEFGSAKLTNMHTHEPIPDAIFSYNEKNSFGLLRFDTTLDDPTVTNEFWTIDGEKVFSLTVPLSDLKD
jgi:alkaline phosphatase D